MGFRIYRSPGPNEWGTQQHKVPKPRAASTRPMSFDHFINACLASSRSKRRSPGRSDVAAAELSQIRPATLAILISTRIRKTCSKRRFRRPGPESAHSAHPSGLDRAHSTARRRNDRPSHRHFCSLIIWLHCCRGPAFWRFLRRSAQLRGESPQRACPISPNRLQQTGKA